MKNLAKIVTTSLNPEEIANVKAVLHEALTALSHFDPVEDNSFNVRNLTEKEQAFLHEILGKGAISMVQKDDLLTHIQQSAFAGVWHIQCFDPNNPTKLYYDGLEVADVPQIIKEYTFENAQKQLSFETENLADSLLNLEKLNTACASYAAEKLPQVLELSLLSQTARDLAVLTEIVGEGTTSILLRNSTGSMQIKSTNVDKLWWTRCVDADDRLISNKLEVCVVPNVVCTAVESFAESAARLAEILNGC